MEEMEANDDLTQRVVPDLNARPKLCYYYIYAYNVFI